MKIIVESDNLIQIAETIKKLPVNGGYVDSDRWVGCVMSLEMMANNSEIYEEKPAEG